MPDGFPLPAKPRRTGELAARFRAHLGRTPYSYAGSDLILKLMVPATQEMAARRLSQYAGQWFHVEITLAPIDGPEEVLAALIEMVKQEEAPRPAG